MKVLIDTCIVIDFLRGYQPAIDYFSAMDEQPLISTITIAELYAGAKNQSKKRAVDEILSTLVVVDVTPEIAKRAGDWACRFTPSHGTDLPDALIAATTEEHNCTLATCNLKHFPMFPEMCRPY